MNKVKSIYKILRSVVMTIIVSVAVLYTAVYVLISIPSVQERIKTEIIRECSDYIGGTLDVESLSVAPFSEVLLKGVSLQSPSGEKCVEIGKVSAGIDLWQFISSRKIVISYAYISGLNADITQKEKAGPLNIQFIIDALSPKDKDKPSTLFDLKFRNVVIRDSRAKFERLWMSDSVGAVSPMARMEISDLKMDLSIPRLSNDDYNFDIRNLQFVFNNTFILRHLGGKVTYKKSDNPVYGNAKKDYVIVEDLTVDLPKSHLEFGKISYDFSDNPVSLEIDGFLSPSDLGLFYKDLLKFPSGLNVSLAASVSKSRLEIDNLELVDSDNVSKILLCADISGLTSTDSIEANLNNLDLILSGDMVSEIIDLVKIRNEKVIGLLDKIGHLSLKGEGALSMKDNIAEGSAKLKTMLGDIDLDASLTDFKSRDEMKSSIFVNASDLDIGKILDNGNIGRSTFEINAQMKGSDRNVSGDLDMHVAQTFVNNVGIDDVDLSISKAGDDMEFFIDSHDENMLFTVNGSCQIGDVPHLSTDIIVARLQPVIVGGGERFSSSEISVTIGADVTGNSLDDMLGKIELADLIIKNRKESKRLYLNDLTITSHRKDDCPDRTGSACDRLIRLESDWIDAEIDGNIIFSNLKNDVMSMLSNVFPSLMQESTKHGLLKGSYVCNDNASTAIGEENSNNFKLRIKVPGITAPYEFFRLPVRPLSDIDIQGEFDAYSGKGSLKIDARHLQQGVNKLIRDTRLDLEIDRDKAIADIKGTTVYPAKKGDVQLAVDVKGFNDLLNAKLSFNPTLKSSLKGDVGLIARFSRVNSIDKAFSEREGNALAIDINILPSSIMMSGTPWSVADGRISYCGERIDVKNFRIEHGNQFVKINGNVSENFDDQILVKLNEIDLDYIFGMLNINYVTFGGMASGEVVGSRLLTKSPEAHTKFLNVRNLSYNGAILGNGDLAADYNADQKSVEIYAVIKDTLTKEMRAKIDGGIWVTRDSLSFSFDADKVNLSFMKPFVSAFCSDLKGKGSGKCKLYGTFSDIDLIGGLYADTLGMKLDFTNTWYYAGGDSVKMGKGLIEVPPVTLYDKYGNSAEFSGWLRHRYFHEPVFDFKIRDAKGILCYDTNEQINPLWYGTIFGSGSGQVTGRPGAVEIAMDMTTGKGSTFTYVISDSEEIDEYSFLSFTDRRKTVKELEKADTVPQYLRQFIKHKQDDAAGSSDVVLNLRGTVTPEALVTIVMDPKGGDKITAHGVGGLQMDYTSADNNLRMFGKYILDEGNYNFTLQDIIIKNFIIRRGSTISFNGDPMDANLDISATYRVNTNLTDLDKSFATDKELNRTNVPVDALLRVTGPMTQPDINFDIELPTLTSDVERKVKSIVSTNDMMSRQIIYLLALNRFYTPEYTGNSSSGAEWSSMASSTISSQLSNMLSQMTDKLSVAPSFRSDKGDFTDMEFDLALSSRLLNNRLLINGNLGYRDRNTSSTQFIGDFDIEYLLNRNGNLRLKAYNHFNDQNYYLRSALTTQGVGVLYRWDFDRLFKSKNKFSKFAIPVDSVKPIANDSLLFLKEKLK